MGEPRTEAVRASERSLRSLPPPLRVLWKAVEDYAGKLKLSMDYDGSVATVKVRDYDTNSLLGAVHITRYTAEDGREAYGASAWLTGDATEEQRALVKRFVRAVRKELRKAKRAKRQRKP
jgi:hypothetical protein